MKWWGQEVLDLSDSQRQELLNKRCTHLRTSTDVLNGQTPPPVVLSSSEVICVKYSVTDGLSAGPFPGV